MNEEYLQAQNHGYDDAVEGRGAMLPDDSAYMSGWHKGNEIKNSMGFPDDGDHAYDNMKERG